MSEKTKKALMWALTAFFLLGAVVYMPSIASLFMLITAVFFAPIQKLQAIYKKTLPQKGLRPFVAVVLAFISILAIPSIFDTAGPSPSHTYEPNEKTVSPKETIPTAEPTAGLTPEPTPGPTLKPTDEPNVIGENSSFEVHFIDVGQADAALVLCDGKALLIDGGNKADSSLIYSYLKKHSITHLDYIVCTHAHEDHVGGLAGALNYATVGVAYSPVSNYDSEAFSDFIKYLDKQNVGITIPSAGDRFKLGSATVTILGPLSPSSEPNNTSIVLRIVYGETSFLFTGDAEREEEQEILAKGFTLKSTVLKVGHHGSETSTSYPFLREIMPEYGVISVGLNNSYGHPADDALSRLRDAEVTVFRTDLQGTIICTSDGKTVTFIVERNSDIDTLASVGPNSLQNELEQQEPEDSSGTQYVLNTNTMKFHYPSCSSVSRLSEKNKEYFTGTRDELIDMGYSPCGICEP